MQLTRKKIFKSYFISTKHLWRYNMLLQLFKKSGFISKYQSSRQLSPEGKLVQLYPDIPKRLKLYYFMTIFQELPYKLWNRRVGLQRVECRLAGTKAGLYR